MSETPAAPLETRLASLAEAVARLEARVALLETLPLERAGAAEAVPQELVLPPIDVPSPVRVMGLIGRVCLILGGATFIRSLVDAHTLPQGWGVALGLAYAVAWALLAARARTSLDAAFHALASVLIAYPLIVESSSRFGILAPGLAALLLLAVTVLHAAVAWRRDLQPIMWTATLASLASGLALMSARQSIEPFLVVFLALGLGSLWLTYGRRWHGLRWPTALAADLGVLILTSLAAWPGGVPEAYRGISPATAAFFGVALGVLYVGSFAVRMSQRERVATTFELVQTALVLLVGCGGALRVALASGTGTGPLGVGIALAGVGSCAAAARFAKEEQATRANFNFFSFLALVLLLMGTPLLLPVPLFATLCGVLGMAAMLGALRLGRSVLVVQSGLLLAVATAVSGLGGWIFRAFLDPAGPPPAPSWAILASLATLAATVALFLLRPPTEALPARIRPVVLLLGAATVAGLGGLAVRLSQVFLASGPPDLGALAVVRTAVLSLLAVALAWSARKLASLDLRWLVYPILVITALKFLLEDVPAGRPLTLFLGFMCFGATLTLAPRLLKSPSPPEADGAPNPSTPEVDS